MAFSQASERRSDFSSVRMQPSIFFAMRALQNSMRLQEPGETFVSRGNKLHLREDVLLMAQELDREYPELRHWAAPATEAELALHAAQLTRLMAEETH